MTLASLKKAPNESKKKVSADAGLNPVRDQHSFVAGTILITLLAIFIHCVSIISAREYLSEISPIFFMLCCIASIALYNLCKACKIAILSYLAINFLTSFVSSYLLSSVDSEEITLFVVEIVLSIGIQSTIIYIAPAVYEKDYGAIILPLVISLVVVGANIYFAPDALALWQLIAIPIANCGFAYNLHCACKEKKVGLNKCFKYSIKAQTDILVLFIDTILRGKSPKDKLQKYLEKKFSR